MATRQAWSLQRMLLHQPQQQQYLQPEHPSGSAVLSQLLLMKTQTKFGCAASQLTASDKPGSGVSTWSGLTLVDETSLLLSITTKEQSSTYRMHTQQSMTNTAVSVGASRGGMKLVESMSTQQRVTTGYEKLMRAGVC